MRQSLHSVRRWHLNIEQMKKNVADALAIEVSQVNIKATTEEGLGFTGSGEGISAQANCVT